MSERCELKARAHLVGDLKAARLVIEEGATFVGKSEVTLNKGNLPTKGSTSTPAAESAPKTDESKAPAFTGSR